MSQQEFFFVDNATGALRGSFVGSADEAAAHLVAEFAGGGVSIANEPPDAPAIAPVLSPVRFEWLLAYTGLDDVWEALMATLKETDRVAFATLKAQRAKTQFHLSVTLAVVDQYRDQVMALMPDAQISNADITAAWALAAEAQV